MYKLITIDVDDTLLTDDHIVTEGTREAMAQAIERGVVVTLATGRMYASARNIASQINLNVPLITYQGSLVKNLMDGKVLYERHVPQEVTRQLFQFCQERGLHIQTYTDDKLYALEENERLLAYCNLSKIPYYIESDHELLMSRPSTKLIIIDEPEVLDGYAPELRRMFGDQAHITKSKPNFLEVLHPEGTKGHAVTFLAKHFGFELSEVIAIGDSWNDHEMLEVAGLGVAMANAVPALKEIANYVTLSNNDEGVKHVIEKFVLQAE
jgi:Cof subfamily protein (haloacid dehalogenase superfamily)